MIYFELPTYNDDQLADTRNVRRSRQYRDNEAHSFLLFQCYVSRGEEQNHEDCLYNKEDNACAGQRTAMVLCQIFGRVCRRTHRHVCLGDGAR